MLETWPLHHFQKLCKRANLLFLADNGDGTELTLITQTRPQIASSEVVILTPSKHAVVCVICATQLTPAAAAAPGVVAIS